LQLKLNRLPFYAPKTIQQNIQTSKTENVTTDIETLFLKYFKFVKFSDEVSIGNNKQYVLDKQFCFEKNKNKYLP